MLSVAIRDELAADLAQAERSREPIAPLTAAYPGIDVVDAYEIQLINIRQRVAEGARVLGHKVGLSSKAMQQMMGVDEPDYGHLLDEMEVFEDTPVKAGRYLYPRVEVEVGFILAADLPGADCTEDDVLAGTEALVPSIELIDTRITDWKIALCDTIADNASSGLYVVGASPKKLDGLELRLCGMVMDEGGDEVSVGAGAACLGDPLSATLWLAKTMAKVGRPLKTGDTVMSGALGPMVAVKRGEVYEARISGLGSVRACFCEGVRRQWRRYPARSSGRATSGPIS